MSANDNLETVMRHVLWHFEEHVNGWEPGTFTRLLLLAVHAADADNRARLARAFPAYVMAWGTAMGDEGLAELRELLSNLGAQVSEPAAGAVGGVGGIGGRAA